MSEAHRGRRLDPHSYELVPWGRIADIDVDKTDRMVVQYSGGPTGLKKTR